MIFLHIYIYIYIHNLLIYLFLFIDSPSASLVPCWCPAGASGTAPEDVDAVSFLEISKKRAWQPWMLLGCWAKLRE